MKKRKFKALCVAIFAFILTLAVLVPGKVQASSGLVTVVQDAGHQYSSYGLENYDLDFYVDMSWTWLPWNWTDGISRGVMHGLYSLTNGLWGLSRLLSYGTGEIVVEAYRFDIINELADSIGANMQKLAGVSPSGFSTEGFYPGFLLMVIVVLGVYVSYVGLYKREMSKALGAVASTVIIFIFGAAFIAYAPDIVRNLNEFSTEVSTGALELGTELVIPGAETGDGDSVDRIRDQLFNVQIYQPWLILQFGTADIDTIGAERVNNLLSVSPDLDYGQTRETVVKTEIETYGNMNLSTTKVVGRFGEVLFILIVNLLISIFVILLSGMMIITQLLFIVYVMFLAIAFVLAMFPTFGGMLKKALLKVFNIIMLRAGYMILITVTFMISSMIYSIADNHSFVTIGFLQIILYAAVFLNKNEILEFMSLKSDRGVTLLGGVGAAAAYYKMSNAARRHEWNKRRRRDYVKGKIREGVAKAGNAGRAKVASYADSRLSGLYGTDRETVARNTRMNEQARRKREFDYTAAKRTPDVRNADFYGKRSQAEVSSGQIYDKYLNRMHGRDLGRMDKPHYDAAYRTAEQTPHIQGADIKDPVKREAANKYRRPDLWDRRIKGDELRGKYQGNLYKEDAAALSRKEDAGNMTGNVAASSGIKRYHAANRADVPRMERVNRNEITGRSFGGGNISVGSSGVKNERIRTSGSRSAGEAYELVDSASIRKQEENDMGTRIKESRNYRRTGSNWRTTGAESLKPKENAGRNVKHGGNDKGNWRGQ